MKYGMAVSLLSAAVIVSAGHASAATPPATQATTPPPPYKIAGLSAVMPSSEVERTMAAAGFKRTTNSLTGSFEDRVKVAVAQAHGRAYNYQNSSPDIQIYEKGGEKVQVWYVQTPGKAILKEMFYQTPTANQSRTAVLTELVRRYGKPRYDTRHDGAGWCASLARPTQCDDRQTRLILQSEGGDNVRIDLMVRRDAEDMMREKVADVARSQGGTQKASF